MPSPASHLLAHCNENGPHDRFRCNGPELRARVARLASDQHGAIARRQLLARGVSVETIDSWLKRRWLVGLHRGVYALGWRPKSDECRFAAAVLACGDDAMLSHRAAAALWGLLEWHEGAIDVTVVDRRRQPRAGIRPHWTGQLDARETTHQRGIPVTDVARTLIDCGTQLRPVALRRAINEALVQRLTTETELLARTARTPLRPGSGQVKEILRVATSRTRSVLEDLAIDLIERHALALPTVNQRVNIDGDVTYEVDLLWRREKAIVELDGGRYHAPITAQAIDATRQRALRASGYRVLRLTWSDVVHDEYATARRLRAHLDRVHCNEDGR